MTTIVSLEKATDPQLQYWENFKQLDKNILKVCTRLEHLLIFYSTKSGYVVSRSVDVKGVWVEDKFYQTLDFSTNEPIPPPIAHRLNIDYGKE